MYIRTSRGHFGQRDLCTFWLHHHTKFDTCTYPNACFSITFPFFFLLSLLLLDFSFHSHDSPASCLPPSLVSTFGQPSLQALFRIPLVQVSKYNSLCCLNFSHIFFSVCSSLSMACMWPFVSQNSFPCQISTYRKYHFIKPFSVFPFLLNCSNKLCLSWP